MLTGKSVMKEREEGEGARKGRRVVGERKEGGR